MSDDKIKVQDTYDFSKNIENISLSTTYIAGLENLMMYFVRQMADPSVLTGYFKKFEEYINGNLDMEKNPFSEEEAQLYTIFSLQQLLKANAYDQGLNVKVDATIDQSLVEDLMKAINDNKLDKIEEINAKMNEQVNQQLS